MRTSVKNTSLNDVPPLICLICLISTPGASIGTRKAVSPLCLTTSGSVRVISSPHCENWAPELQVFCPLTIHSSPSRSARHDRLARSEPAPGSENSWQHRISAASSGPTKRSFCSGVPNRSTVGEMRPVVTLNVSWRAGMTYSASRRAKAAACSRESPSPPISGRAVMA